MNYNQFPLADEDPLAGDVDRVVHPDETRTEEQINFEDQFANRLHASGDDGADEYWADYDEYHGTTDDESSSVADTDSAPKTTITPSENLEDFVYVTTPKGRTVGMSQRSLTIDYAYRTPDEIGEMIDEEEDDRIAQQRQDDEDNIAWEAAHPDHYDDEDEYEEDPLEGDVDRWVDPNETKD